MSIWLLPLGATAASGLVTYYSCVRPIRRGQTCHPGMAHSARGFQEPCPSTGIPVGDGEEIRRLAGEVQLLRHELDPRGAAGSTQ